MIHYNMRYRGPYEYEKFILNVLQYSNNAHDFSSEVNGLEEYETLKEIARTGETGDVYRYMGLRDKEAK